MTTEAWKAIIITGASRGFGRCLAVSYAKSAVSKLQLILSGRDVKGLEETRAAVLAHRPDASTIEVLTVPADLGSLDQLEGISAALFGEQNFPAGRAYDEVALYHNAGSLGLLAPIGSTQLSLTTFTDCFNLNVTSSSFLTSNFIQRLKDEKYLAGVQKVHVVNISSLAAIQAFTTWGLYCAAKAARDMFHKTLAEEVKKAPPAGRTVSVLSYAPGPMDTEMNSLVRNSPEADSETKAFYQEMKDLGKLVQPQDSADKVVGLLTSGLTFSGEHVDFYDV